MLKQAWPLKVFAVRPTASPVLSGGSPSPHPIQGHQRGLHPGSDEHPVMDGVIQVEAKLAREYSRRCARGGPARGHLQRRHAGRRAQKLPRLAAGARVLGFSYDTGRRYLSVEATYPPA